MLMDLAELWKQQCEAAVRIREEFGWQKGIGYLIGEKLLNHYRVLRDQAEGVARMESMAQDVRDLFPRGELASYFKNYSRTGALGHILDDDSHRELAKAGFVGTTPAQYAEDLVLMEQLRQWLLKEG